MTVNKMADTVDRIIREFAASRSESAGKCKIEVSSKLLIRSEVLEGANSHHLKFFFGDRMNE